MESIFTLVPSSKFFEKLVAVFSNFMNNKVHKLRNPYKNLETNSLYKLPDARRLRLVKPPRPMRRRRQWGGQRRHMGRPLVAS